MIVLLRNPIDRAYSHYQHGRRHNYEALPGFKQALEAESERLAGERKKILDERLAYFGYAHQFFSYASRGIYADQIMEWRNYFPEESMMIIKSEDYYANPPKVLEAAQRHLGVSTRELKVPPNRHKDNRDADYPPMHPETRRRLVGYFASHNERLYDYLGVDFGWE